MTKKATIYVETDWDFCLVYKGLLYVDSKLNIELDDYLDLDRIEILPEGGKHKEWNDAIEIILNNPEKEFSNIGGNRGVQYSPAG